LAARRELELVKIRQRTLPIASASIERAIADGKLKG
jgi:hypothetical protein